MGVIVMATNVIYATVTNAVGMIGSFSVQDYWNVLFQKAFFICTMCASIQIKIRTAFSPRGYLQLFLNPKHKIEIVASIFILLNLRLFHAVYDRKLYPI